ncbi:hypothetical protein [Pendulispora albinea]|uniref:Uncharacterized protein n=1 Tax=Pendulispora albinea TaxID=2741071 RepID=A0ABZ2LZN3_9BACT
MKAIEHAEVRADKSNGAADLNYFSAPNAIVLDGLGARGGKMHTSEEFVHLDSLESRARALRELLGLADKDL